MKSGMARESDVRNRDERCRTMKGRVSGALEEYYASLDQIKSGCETCQETDVVKFTERHQTNPNKQGRGKCEREVKRGNRG